MPFWHLCLQVFTFVVASASQVQDNGILMLLQTQARAHNLGTVDPYAPRMMVSQGCDGSTIILEHAYHILPMHGVDAGPVEVQKELLDPPRNPFMGPENQDIFVAMKRMVDEHKENKTALVFKSIVGRDTATTLDKRLLDLGTLAVFNYRRNILDRLVCLIRDCFLDTNPATTPYGYPVDADGKLADMCFDRRDKNTNDKDYKAWLNTTRLAHNLNWLVRRSKGAEKMIREAGYHAQRVSYEDLVAFEESAEQVPVSLKAWSKLLTSWGVEPSQEKLRGYLLKNSGSHRPEPTRNVVYNIEELEQTIREHPKFVNLGLLRS